MVCTMLPLLCTCIILFPVSNYIREASAIPAVENINVSCSVEQSEPPLICSAVFRCADNQATTLNLSSAVVNFMTTQPCDVIIQVVPSNNITRVLQATPFNDVSPLEQPTIPPSTTSTPIPTSTPTSISPTSEHLCIILCADCCIRVYMKSRLTIVSRKAKKKQAVYNE